MYELTHRVTDCRKLAVFLSAYVFSIVGSQCHPSTEPHYVKHGVGTAAHSGRLYVLVFIMYNVVMFNNMYTHITQEKMKWLHCYCVLDAFTNGYII